MPSSLADQSVLQQRIDLLGDDPLRSHESLSALDELAALLEFGALRVAEPNAQGWQLNLWVKRALVLFGRLGQLAPQPGSRDFLELDTLPWRTASPPGARIAAGSVIRRTAHIAPGTTVIPPSVIQVGTFIASGCTIDSHATIGACAQLGHDVNIGCGAIVGGVLFPAEAMPVILEDGVVLGGGAAVYGSVQIGSGTMLTAGTVISHYLNLYHVAENRWISPNEQGVLHVPPKSIITMGVPASEKPGSPPMLVPMIVETL